MILNHSGMPNTLLCPSCIPDVYHVVAPDGPKRNRSDSRKRDPGLREKVKHPNFFLVSLNSSKNTTKQSTKIRSKTKRGLSDEIYSVLIFQQ